MLDPVTLAELRALALRKRQPLRKWLRLAGLSPHRLDEDATEAQAAWVRRELERLPDQGLPNEEQMP